METITSKIYTLSNPRELYLKEEILDPASIKEDELIAKTIYSAISPGTEVAAYCGVEPLRDDVSIYPRLVGYCNLAQIIHKGSAVENWKIGDYILTFQSHRSHFKCRTSDFLIKINPDFLKESVVAYLYHLGFHSILTANLQAGHNVAVLGLGVLGYTTAIFSKNAGANVFTFSNQKKHQELLESKGINFFPKTLDSIKEIEAMTDGVGIDIVINTSNSWSDWALALNYVNKGGTIVNLGFPGRGQDAPNFNPLDPKFLYTKNVTIKYLSPLNVRGVEADIQRFNRERNLSHILNLIENSSINSTEIITSEIDYTELESQYKLYESQTKNLFSTLIKW
ncbi:MAG: threonine dehydrogenase-like Zn-dependent dehydrogenase [Aureispira sp.]|jgi:threonine dehydrogenase-like Zn-dependent dehydrogenase